MEAMVDDFDCFGGDYVELRKFPDEILPREIPATFSSSTTSPTFVEPSSRCRGKENFVESGPTRASLYRSKIPKVRLNPGQPLANPYRVSRHDQMPIRVIPSPMGKKGPQKVPKKASPARKVRWEDVAVRDVTLTPKDKAASMDNLLMTSSHHCYVTRSVLKRINESKLDESNFSLSSNDSDDKNPEFSQTLTRNKLRSSKSRKYRQKFNFGIFTKNSRNKSKSEFALNDARNVEFTDTPRKRKKIQTATENVSTECCKKEESKQERSFVRNNKRRLSGFRLKIQKKFGSKDEKFGDDGSSTKEDLKQRMSPGKRKGDVICNLMCDTYDYEANNNNETMTLHDVLTNKDLCEEFRQFLASEHSDENLDFWTMCERFKTSNDRSNLAEIICRQFLREAAPREVNLDAKTKSTLDTNTWNLTSSSFTTAQDSIYRLMEADSFRRFCVTRRSKRLKTE